MLYNVAYTKNDDDFEKIIKEIGTAYWPEDKYLKKRNKLPSWPDPPSEEEIIEKTETALKEITHQICNPTNKRNGLYKQIIFNKNNYRIRKTVSYPIPFLDRFQTLFLERKYNTPFRDPKKEIESLVRMEKPTQEWKKKHPKEDGNYSKNFGNYNHFINVVMVTARLIDYFKQDLKFVSTFGPEKIIDEEEHFFSYSSLAYKNVPNRRTFKLMLSAFYHDIGKTVVDHRHGMEGSFIIADHNLKALNQLEEIFSQYSNTQIFERDDLLEIADFLYYHDFFGTLGTGESSYLLLSSILDRFKRYSMRHIEDKEKQIGYSKKSLFDLWILNIADIMVSVKDKWKDQKDVWLSSDISNDEIEIFFKGEGGKNRIHDLKLSFVLLKNINRLTHTDDISKIEHLAHRHSQNHTIERIRRLINCSLNPVLISLEKRFTEEKKKAKKPRLHEKSLSLINHILDKNNELKFTNGFMSLIILRCIQCMSNSKEFCDKLSWIGSMDYALGFFQKIVERIIIVTDKEFENISKTKVWYHKIEKSMSPEEKKKINEANATILLENYTAIVIRILGYLLFREKSIDKISNIEFEDTRNRLTDEKINKIIALEGPYKANKSIELILKTIFVY